MLESHSLEAPEVSETSPGLTGPRASALAFAIAGATLALQVLIHRIVSAKLLNNSAFLVISLTMLGFAVSGVVLTAGHRLMMRRLPEVMLGGSCLLALFAVAATAVFAGSHLEMGFALSRVALVRTLFDWSPYAFLFTIPFAVSGTLLGALLSDERLASRRVYFFDLVGSAVGALVVLPLIRWVGVESAILITVIALVVSVAMLVPPRGTIQRLLVVVTCVTLLVAFQKRNELFEIYYPKGSMLASTREPNSDIRLEYTEWDPLARIEVSSFPGRTVDPKGLFGSLFGENAAFLSRYRKVITQNNFAFTFAVEYDGRPESLVGIEETIYAAAYYATPIAKPRVVAIGVGGGFDILTALRFDASQITGVEINAATVNIVKNVFGDYFHHWVQDPRVTIVNAEGRHYLSSRDEKFDVIQLSGVDSYSGTPGAAHVFSENYLYTAEAFDLYLKRLSDGGVLNVMRLEHKPQREMLRALTTAVAALRRLGVVRPRNHIVTLTEHTGAFTAMLVKRTPFDAADMSRLRAWVTQRPSFGITAEPGLNEAEKGNSYQGFLSLGDEKLERGFIAQYPFAVGPTTDDNPFFFNFAYWWHLFPEDATIWLNTPTLPLSLLILSFAVGVAAVFAVIVPLALLLRRGVAPSPKTVRFSVYFAGAALGYLGIEVALMQIFGLFLGHPNYAISVVLAALLFWSGVGALQAETIVRRLSGIRFVAYALALTILLEFSVVVPALSSGLALPFWIRSAATVFLILPIGLCLGVFLPTAIDLMKRISPELVPWAWGINGVFSVLAPLLAVAVATTFGLSALLLATVPIYLIVAWSLPAASSRGPLLKPGSP
jgi:spermidine synthase